MQAHGTAELSAQQLFIRLHFGILEALLMPPRATLVPVGLGPAHKKVRCGGTLSSKAATARPAQLCLCRLSNQGQASALTDQ